MTLRPGGSLILLIICMLLCAEAGHAFRERERTYDVLHYSINIAVDQKQKSVSGTVAMRLVPLNQTPALEIDAAEMEIGQVTFASSTVPLQHTVKGEKLLVVLPRTMKALDTLTITIHYSCSPRNGLYFFEPDSAYPSRPFQVWSQGKMKTTTSGSRATITRMTRLLLTWS